MADQLPKDRGYDPLIRFLVGAICVFLWMLLFNGGIVVGTATYVRRLNPVDI
jgi:hypothetical protein